jgi:23S rRNA (uracil1939-C5)-methyltransferase
MNGERATIERMVYGGAGVTRVQGESVFVPFVLPGEVVELGAGETTVLEASADRVAPGCRHFGVCGGCQYQHASYEAQLGIKREIVRGMLERHGVDAASLQVHAREPWRYRNRIRVRLQRAEGAWRAGYSERGSNTFMAASECPIAAPLLWRAVEALMRVAEFLPMESREVELFCDAEESALQVSVMLDATVATMEREGAARFRRLCEAMAREVPQMRGAGMWVWAEAQRGVRTPKQRAVVETVRWGEETLPYVVQSDAERYTYAMRRGGFFQVNRFLVGELIRLAVGEAHGGRAWDLYAGVGLFTQALMQRFTHVTAVEVGQQAFAELQSMIAGGSRAVQKTTVEFLRGAVALPNAVPELVIVDPPRAGLGAEVCDLLGKMGAAKMVYVSCDPETLSRDLKRLLEFGYRVEALHMVDLFPQTFHVETVAILRR